MPRRFGTFSVPRHTVTARLLLYAVRRLDMGSGQMKTSTHVSVEVVGMTLSEAQVEANALCVPSASTVQLETSYISTDDRFAALLDSSVTPLWRRTRRVRVPAIACDRDRPSGPPMYASLSYGSFLSHSSSAV